MNWFKNNAEIIIGYILGIIFIAMGLFIIWNGSSIIHFKEVAVNKLHMVHIFDFINIYLYALVQILSHYIHAYPLFIGLFIMFYGFGFIYTSRLLKRSTRFDQTIAYFYLLSALFLFTFTGVLMFEVYSYFALLFVLSFGALIFYIINRRRLNDDFRKLHYISLLILFSIAYLVTQTVVYDNLANNAVTPLDVMALNFFFILLTSLGVLALGNYIFLARSKKVVHHEMSRLNKGRDRKVSEMIGKQTNEAFHQLTKQSLKADERVMLLYQRTKRRIIQTIDLKDEDIPGWMRRPKWFKFFHIEVLFGILMLILTLIELNNRNILFNVSRFNVVKMQYFYEWINLFGLLIVILAYLFFTLLIRYKNKGYFGQLITVTMLFIKLMTSVYLMLFKGVNLALFIPPVALLLALMIIPLFFGQLRKHY